MKTADLIEHVQRFWAKVDRHTDPAGCWPWTGPTNNHGYGRFECNDQGRRTRVLAHRLAVVLSGIHLSPDQKVLHNCDNTPCCNPAHLRVGTQRDNIRDAIDRGRVNLSGLEIGQRMSTVYRGEPAACGTESGATRHRRRGEPVCDPCRQAVSTANAARRERRRIKPKDVPHEHQHDHALHHVWARTDRPPGPLPAVLSGPLHLPQVPAGRTHGTAGPRIGPGPNHDEAPGAACAFHRRTDPGLRPFRVQAHPVPRGEARRAVGEGPGRVAFRA